MNPNETDNGKFEFNRREFIRGASFSTMMLLMGGVPLQAGEEAAPAAGATKYSTVGAPVSVGVIGCGLWGRELLATLALLPNAPVVAVADNYPAFLRRAREAAPKAEGYEDYHKLLEQKDVQAVIVATPTHQHRQVVEDALAAGKHVYCEAPVAATVEDARAIAKAAKAAVKLNFQAGLQHRSDPQKHFLLQFIRSGAMGKTISARSQWHKKESWRRTSPNPDREKAINWRLSKKTSAGLLGEVGIQQIDLVFWFINELPIAVSGVGGILNWTDGRDVADTVQSLIQFPGGVNFSYDCTLANSFDADYDMIYGTDAAVMMRGHSAWMFKEVDAPLLGWEVYARKDQFYRETGIALVADATKQSALLNKPGEEAADVKGALQCALEAFIQNSRVTAEGVDDFIAGYGEDLKKLREYLGTLGKSKLPAAGWQEGLAATVLALKANEAAQAGEKLELKKEWFEI